MEIVIAGGGRVGARTAVHLADEGQTVTIVESDAATAGAVPERDSIRVVVGDAVSPETYTDIPLDGVDAFAALTGDTNANVAACYMARSASTLRTVARIGAEEERQYSDHSAVDAVVFPEAAGARNATDLLTDA